MPQQPATRVVGRAIVGVIALYGLLLQAFLGAAAPRLPDGLPGIVCTVDGDHRSPDGPAHRDHPCCTAAQPGALAAPPMSGSVVPVPVSDADAVVWRAERPPSGTGPPTHAHSARGPPSA